MTNEEFIEWLRGCPEPTVLIEALASVGGVETMRYVSNNGYTSRPTDVPANQYYDARLVGGASITTKLALDGSGASIGVGDAELMNADGALDSWLVDDVWVNRRYRMLVGDWTWDYADFRVVFDGITDDIGSRDANTVNLRAVDKLQRLNTAVSETKLGGATANADKLIPLCFGEVFNIEPLLTDPATLEYQIHDGEIEDIIEVRDNGNPVGFTPHLATGKFNLLAPLSNGGVITCSAQGAKLNGVYVNTVAKLVELLATEYGADPFVADDLDAANLAAFDAANPQAVGVYLPDRENVRAVCDALAASVGGQMVASAAGKLRLLKIALPATGTPTEVNEERATALWQIGARPAVVAAIKLGYCKNWTVQKNIKTGIPDEHKDLFGQEWRTATARDAAVALAYRLTQEPVQVDTYLLAEADAQAQAAERLALWGTQRKVVMHDGAPELMLEELGGYQTLTYSRFGLDAGMDAQTVELTLDWLNLQSKFGSLL